VYTHRWSCGLGVAYDDGGVVLVMCVCVCHVGGTLRCTYMMICYYILYSMYDDDDDDEYI